ncbi:hypothetical protein BV921_05495 [Pectobacterium odoriferum]|uniref:Membrane protein n=2 Tax=Pectobacterium odoriferum TaxID=78398 RepID=A0ABR4VT33_9GAMM|nr:DUF2645 family protein [Pectobacterium odoriferum]GKW03230.1 hypothetical protein PEC301877_20430 [Pectobacterium carotovorum subsp. carotovorum]KGA42545.1 membrane protein [Pectobacterium odoriferum]MCH5008944.1 YjeO family protein [Pectobacterium odoriferum]POE02575.1 hypothetical protein BVY05_07105 [Pectobacterium odoriferum]POE11824.1 hypothetical protein BV921_05495 [Pectobacterium odoriferum]
MPNYSNMTYNILFYFYSILCALIILITSIRDYEGMVDGVEIRNLCEIPEADSDGFFAFIIIPLSIPFFIVKKSLARAITYIILLFYYFWSFYLRFTLC